MATSVPALVCAYCEGTRWEPSPDGRGVLRCRCVQASRVRYAEGVPLEYRDATLGTYRVPAGAQSAVRAATAFLAATTGDLYLCGGVGAGKTRLACSVLNEAHRTTRGGLFVRVPKLLLDLQLLFSGTAPEDRLEERAYLERLYTAPLLVLDDVGVEKASDYSHRTLYTIYEERGDTGRRTIWTSNLDLAPDPSRRDDPTRPPTLGEFMGDIRLPSRIVGRGTVCYLNVRDQRLPFNRRRSTHDE